MVIARQGVTNRAQEIAIEEQCESMLDGYFLTQEREGIRGPDCNNTCVAQYILYDASGYF